MTLKKLFATLGAAALVGLMSSCPLLPAQAQGPVPGQGNPFQNFNIPPSLFFGMMGQATGGIDPTHSAAMQLLQRNDVRNEIAFDLKQQNALDELKTKSQQDFQKTMMSTIQESMQSLREVPQDQQQAQIQDRMNQFGNTVQTFQGDVDKRTEALLRAKQLARLHELDLRWRGPMALSDAKVATALKLTPDQSNKVTTSVREFMDEQQKAVMQAVMPMAGGFGRRQPAPPVGNKPADAKPDTTNKDTNGAATDNSAQDPNASPQDRAQQMQKKLTDTLHSREMEKTKAAVEAKLLELLTPAQKEQWTTMLGAKFTFRKTEVP